MSQETFFQLYIETIQEGIKAIRKISFKKINILNEFIGKLETFLSKEVYGRIKPTNYLLLFLIALGGRNPKLYPTVILIVQKLFSNNFIAVDQDLSGGLQLLKEEHKQFLLLPFGDYSKKSFQEIYVETLIALPEKTEAINLLISKNLSLIFRLSQNYIPLNLISTICDYFVDAILISKNDEYDKILKSTFLQIVRHAIQSLKQASDRKLLESDQEISIKQICHRYGSILADQVAIKINVEKNQEIRDYQIIPKNNDGSSLLNFKLFEFDEVNELKLPNGKFGWCIMCRKTANYYCKSQRVPVCSYKCKQENMFLTRTYIFTIEELQKFYSDETKSIAVFTSHVQQFCKAFSKYLSHPDIRKRTAFADTFIHLSSQLRKINVKSTSAVILSCLQDIFQQCCMNLVMETQAFVACGVVIKKLIPLDIFIPQVQILLHELAKKLTHFITPIHIKEQTLKLIRDFIKNETLFEIFMDIDCNKQRKDVVHELVSGISKLYRGIEPPQGITNLPPEDPNTRKFCYDILNQLEKSIKSINQNKLLSEQDSTKLNEMKKQKNLLKNAIQKINKTDKPTKAIKKLISEKYLPKDPQKIAQFLHSNLKKLSFVNIGQLIGDHDPLGISIRDEYIRQMNFKGYLIDEGMRILLSHFNIPGQSQIVDRIIDSFSKQYFEQNKDLQHVFNHSDAVYSFSYLLMMLQTNLHNPQVLQKMTLDQFNNLSKNMNGQGLQFPRDFLQKIYSSIEKKQLGFHSKRHQIQIINAFQKSEIKKAQQIHIKHLQSHLAKEYLNLIPQREGQKRFEKIDMKLLISETFGQIIEAASIKVRESEEKQQLIKNIDFIQDMVKFSLNFQIQDFVALAIKNIWEQITRTNTIKKFILTERVYSWVRQFTPYIYDQWGTIINSFSMFHRSKLIKKENTGKNNILAIVQDKCYLYDSFIDSIIAKSGKFNFTNLTYLIEALVDCSRQEIADTQITFCLQKIGDVYEYNNSRLVEIVPLTWGKIKEYYVDLGKHKIEKVALFGTDFLKQLITKFIKKKDLHFFQKEYLKPLQQVFNGKVPLGVKEYIVGGLSYFVNNYFTNIKDGWRIILAILYQSFEEEQQEIVKEKSHLIVKKIYESNFSIIELQENYVDYAQILSRMAREKDETYIKSCLEAIKSIILNFQNKTPIVLENPQAPENEKLDLIYWQTMWLPLLSIIYGICGDFRAEVQNQSIQLLFYILMRYGKLFKYEFWKMIMQGILRPTFEQITYTSQSKPLRKKQLQQWLRNSFSRLFASINKLILQYFEDFKLFLPDILKIYQSCIISNSNKILTQLSTQALGQLLDSVGKRFQKLNWEQYIQFIKTVLKKSWPTQIDSIQNWKKAQQIPEQVNYQGKILTLNLIYLNCQNTVNKFSDYLQQANMIQLRDCINQSYNLCYRFNKNIELRQALWANKFFDQLRSLPGLNKQQYEGIKAITIVKFKLIEKSQIFVDQFAQHSLKIFQNYKKSLILTPPKNLTLEYQQKERENALVSVLILQNILPSLQAIGLPKLMQLGYKSTLFKHFLDMCSQKSFCAKCNFCEYCRTSGEREIKFSETMKAWLKKLFQFEIKVQEM